MPGFLGRLRRRRANLQRAEALEFALARYRRLLAAGTEAAEARRQASAHLEGGLRELFGLAAGLSGAACELPGPSEEFVEALEARLRSQPTVRRGVRLRSGSPARGGGAARPALRRAAALALAACLVVAAGSAVAARGALPTSPLYPLKRAQEQLRLALASGGTEGRLLVALAKERIREAELITQRAAGTPAAGGLRPVAAGRVQDPRLARLVAAALKEAARNIERAVPLLQRARDPEGLRRAAFVAREGKETATRVAQVLPETVKPPELEKLPPKLESIATAALAVAEEITKGESPSPPPTLSPCETPTPTPAPSPSPEEPAGSPKASPTARPAARGPLPTASPKPTPSPSPSPAPSPTPTPCATPTPPPSPSPAPSPSSPPPQPESPQPKPSATPMPSPSPQPTPKPSPEAASSPQTARTEPAAAGTRTCPWWERLIGWC